MRDMRCGLILVGTELLSGATLDTNSLFMAEELNKYGIKIENKITVGDKLESIIEALKFLKGKSDLIILSGGLGPTDDDLTKVAISKFLNRKLVVNSEEKKEIKEKFKNIGIKFLNKNYKEVERPEGSISIKNDVGMAPAFYVDGVAAFPGVPRELYNMFPKFLKYYKENIVKEIDPIFIKDIIVFGMAESIIEEKIKDFFVEDGIEYEFLIKDYGILIRMQSVFSKKNTVEKIGEKIYNTIGEYIIGEDTQRLETRVIEFLKNQNKKLSVAESCSGGMLSDKFISVPGASQVFYEGLVTYDTKAKINRLNIPEYLVENYGVVSKEIAEKMVEGLKTDVGISITGIAGPLVTEDKPVGLVYIGIKNNDKIYSFEYNFKGNRDTIRRKSVNYALFELYKILKEDEKKGEYRRENKKK